MTQPDKDFDNTSDRQPPPSDSGESGGFLSKVADYFTSSSPSTPTDTPAPAPTQTQSVSARPDEMSRINDQLSGQQQGDTGALQAESAFMKNPPDGRATATATQINDTSTSTARAQSITVKDSSGQERTFTRSTVQEGNQTRSQWMDDQGRPVQVDRDHGKLRVLDAQGQEARFDIVRQQGGDRQAVPPPPGADANRPQQPPPGADANRPAQPPPTDASKVATVPPVGTGTDRGTVPAPVGTDTRGTGTPAPGGTPTETRTFKDASGRDVVLTSSGTGSAERRVWTAEDGRTFQIDQRARGEMRAVEVPRDVANAPNPGGTRTDVPNPGGTPRPGDAPNPGTGGTPRPGDAPNPGTGGTPRPGDAPNPGTGGTPRPGDPAGGLSPGDSRGPGRGGDAAHPGAPGPGGTPRPGDAPGGPSPVDGRTPGRGGAGDVVAQPGQPGGGRANPTDVVGQPGQGGQPGQPGPGRGGDAGVGGAGRGDAVRGDGVRDGIRDGIRDGVRDGIVGRRPSDGVQVPGTPTDATGRPGRDGQAGLPGAVGADGRPVRDASSLAQDLRAAEQKFRGSETQDARADARRELEALRREYADAVRRDPDYGAKVQDAYRQLEGRGKAPEGPPSEILRQSGINLGDQKTRDAMLDVLKKMDAGSLKPEQLDPNSRKMFEAMKTLEPARLEQLKQFLTDLQTPGKQRPDDATIAIKIKEIMDGPRDATDRAKRTDGTEVNAGPKTASERLFEFMKTNKETLGQGLDSEKSRAAMAELNKIVGQMNKELGLDPSKGGINVRDVLARSMEGTVRPGERTERVQTGREETLVAKLNPAQEAAFKGGMERGARTEVPTAQAERRAEGPAATMDRRAEVPAGAERPGARPEGARPEGARPEAGKAEPARTEAARTEAASQVPQKGAQAEGREGKPDVGGKDVGGAKQDIPGQKVAEAAAAAQSTKRGDDAAQTVDPRQQAGRTDMTDKLEDDKKVKKADDKERLEEEQQKLTDAQLAVLAARKAKEDKEREEKEKERAQETDKKEQDARRTKYVVKEKDTLESIAVRMLRDKRLAALILEINKTVIQVRQEQGKKVVDLQPKLVIWLPSPLDIREFRGRIIGAAGEQVDYGAAAQDSTGKALTPEEELAARFGGTAEDYKSDVTPGTTQPTTEQQEVDLASEAVAEMTAEAIAAAKIRRENVEKLLGPVSAPKNVDESGNLKYTVRLGDTLKSVAIKHPALQDVQLWKLLAEVNDLPTDTDAKGTPVAQLKRGTVIKVPPPHMVEEYRKEHNLKAIVPKATVDAGAATIKFDVATKPCPECSRMTTKDAEICPGCGHSFAAAAVVAGVMGTTQKSFAPQPAVPPAPVAPSPAPPAPPAPVPPAPIPQAVTPPPAPVTPPAPLARSGPVPPKPVPKVPSMPGPLPRPGTVFDASPNPTAPDPTKSAGRTVPPPVPRKKTGDTPIATGPLYEEPPAQQPPAQSAPTRPEQNETTTPSLPANFGPSGDENDFTRQLLGGMGFDPAPSMPSAAPPKPTPPEKEVQGFVQQLGDACRMVKLDAASGGKSGLKSHLEVRRSDNTWTPILTYEIYDDVSLRHEFTLDGKRKTIRIDLPPQAVQELADNDLTTNWQNYCQRFLAGRTISD